MSKSKDQPSMAAPPFSAPAWPASSIQMRSPSSLKPNPKNPRTHSTEQIEMLRAAVDEFGWTIPILVDEKDMIWAGHGRQLAALLDPPIEQVPVVVARDWTKDQKMAYMLADNRLGELSGWDAGLLRDQLLALKDKFDLSIAGFDAVALPQFLAFKNTGFADPDAAPPVVADPVVRLGDVWVLGNHRLICGDATDPATVSAVLAGEKPALMVTDPPYGVKYDPAWRTAAGVGSKGAATGVVAQSVTVRVVGDGGARAMWHAVGHEIDFTIADFVAVISESKLPNCGNA